jgi:hypothetical protein
LLQVEKEHAAADTSIAAVRRSLMNIERAIAGFQPSAEDLDRDPGIRDDIKVPGLDGNGEVNVLHIRTKSFFILWFALHKSAQLGLCFAL